MRRAKWGFGLILGLILGGAVLAPAVAGADQLDRVTLQLKWTHQFQFAGYYAAVAQGYYREAGLDVNLIEAQPGEDPVANVLRGGADFGVGNSDLLLFRQRGEPVVVLACVFQHSPLLLVVRAASGVSDLQGLHDRSLMMIDSEKAELFAYFKYEGLDVSRLHVRPHTLRIQDFIEGKVDAMSAYGTDEPYMLHQAGVAFHAFTARSGGIDFYGDNLYTTEAQIRDHPERVRAFRAASLRGWDYALAHPQEMIDYIRQRYPQGLSRPHLQFEAEKTAELMHPGIIEVGHINPGRWRHIADTYAEFGMLPGNFDLTGFLYEPDPRPDLRWIYWSLAAAIVLLIGTLGWALPLVRLNRRLRAANLAKSRYLAFLSHEIRTPLNGIVGMVELMKSGTVLPEQVEQVQLLDHSAQNLLRLVDNVLDHSRIEAGRVEVVREAVTLEKFVREVGELYRPAAQAKGVALRETFASGAPAVVLTDPVRLRQILANLLSNAVKFTAAGSVEVAVAAKPVPEGRGVRLIFQVSDTGPGITAEQQARIFIPFAQAESSVARKFGGSGLGLSISRQLAQMLGGDITLESTPGHGATFVLEIAAEPVANPKG
jgi:signal transduction histidine kinase